MPDSASPPSPATQGRKRRLVPDLSDTIEHGGERLTRVVRAQEKAASSLDEIAKKHLGPEAAQAIKDNSDFLRALGTEAPAALPSDFASRLEIFTDGAVAIPHPEPNAALRQDAFTVSPIALLKDAPDDFLVGKSQPETLFDLFNLFPLLDGVNWWIHVDRKEPKSYAGRKVAGYQRPITSPLTLAEWQDIYGGGTYKLTVYGPPKRGGVMQADGRYAAVKMTEPITVIFPGIPSFESEVYDEDPMTTSSAALSPSGLPHPMGRRGPASMADAQIEKERLTVDAAREIRQESQVDKERARAEAALKDKARGESDLLSKFMEMQDKAALREAELRAEQVVREREIAEERRENDAKWEARIKELIGERKPTDDLEKLSRLSSIIAKPDNSEMLREQHAREIERVQNTSKADAERASDRVREEQKRADSRIEEAAARAAERVREIEKRAADSERELRERSDREMQRVKDEADRRVSDMHRQHTDAALMLTTQHASAMTAETRNHERDMNSLKAQHAMAMESLKASYDMRLETARGEVKRTLSDVDRWKQEAESGKDVVGKLRKLREDAAELGMVEASDASAEPETVPQMLMKTGMGVVQNLPAIIENIGGMFKQRSAQELDAARLQGRRDMVEQAGQGLELPPPHARRRGAPPQLGAGGYVPRHMSEVSSLPLGPSSDPFPVPSPQPAVYQPPEPPPEPSYQAPPAPPFSGTVMPPEPQMRPSLPPPQIQLARPPAPTQPPPPPVVDPAVLAEDQQILQAEQMLLPQYANSVSPEVVAEHMYTELGEEFVRGLVSGVDAERVILAINRSGSQNSPFLRRDGKKYLRALFEELKKKVVG